MNRVSFRIDPILLCCWLGLVAIGLVAIYSSTYSAEEQVVGQLARFNFVRQATWGGLALVALLVSSVVSSRVVQLSVWPIYALAILLLILALAVGVEVNGAKSWISLGPIRFQASEVAKFATVLALGRAFAQRRPGTSPVRFLLGALALPLLPAVLIVLQNDTGTALVFLGLLPVVLFWSGVPVVYVLLVLSPAITGYLAIVHLPSALIIAALLVIINIWITRERTIGLITGIVAGTPILLISVALSFILQPYQAARLISFTNPEAAEFRDNVGFHLVQSKAAIGSGGFAGKGFMEGTQTQGDYVPEQSTDFIFSVIGEEFGFIGGMLVLFLFALLLIRMLVIGAHIKHSFAMMTSVSVASVYLIHIFINIGMATGILPVIGIPLPFISYGGTALLAHSLMLGVVLNIEAHKDEFSIYGY